MIMLLTLIAILPAVLVTVAGTLVVRRALPGAAGRRFWFFLLGLGLLLLLTAAVASLLAPPGVSRFSGIAGLLLTPPLVGMLALAALNLKTLATLPRPSRVLALLLTAAILALLVALRTDPSGLAYMVLITGLPTAIVWLIGGKPGRLVPALGLVDLGLLALHNLAMARSGINGPYAGAPAWLASGLTILLLALPGLTVVLAAVLLYQGLRLSAERGQDGVRLATIGRLGLAALLLGYLAYSIWWISIWDQTSDGLGGIASAMPASVAAIASGMALAFALRGRRRAAGLIFATAVPVLVFGSFIWGQGVNYHAVTDQRAARVEQAIEGFHARTGRYPARLAELVPADLLFVPRPVILLGQDWCYQGGQDYYRLGVPTRDYFSTPLSLRIYRVAGNPPAAGWACDEQLAALKARFDVPPMENVIGR